MAYAGGNTPGFYTNTMSQEQICNITGHMSIQRRQHMATTLYHIHLNTGMVQVFCYLQPNEPGPDNQGSLYAVLCNK